MLELENREMNMQKNKTIKQEEVNCRLQFIIDNLKSIPNISSNYIEYISALICVMYKNGQDIVKLEDGNIENSLEKIDKELYNMRAEEGSERLFINIKFYEVINKEYYDTIEIVINELNNLIMDLEKATENSKAKLAEALEYIIMKAVKNKELEVQNGEFYTPKAIIRTITNLLSIKNDMEIYNPASGTGEFIIEMAKLANINAVVEETNINNYNICMTNLWLHDVQNKKSQKNEEFELADIAIANPPFTTDSKEDIKTNKKLQEIYYRHGISQKASIYTKFLVKMLESINENGRMAIILPHGFLFKKTKSEYNVRRELIGQKYIDAIIGLPEKLFYNTKIPVVILIINKARRRDEVLFIDASREYTSQRKNNIIEEENMKKITETYQKRETILNYSYVANLEEIEKNDYDLNIKKYVKIQNKEEEINQEEIEKNVYKLEQEIIDIQEKIKIITKNV